MNNKKILNISLLCRIISFNYSNIISSVSSYSTISRFCNSVTIQYNYLTIHSLRNADINIAKLIPYKFHSELKNLVGVSANKLKINNISSTNNSYTSHNHNVNENGKVKKNDCQINNLSTFIFPVQQKILSFAIYYKSTLDNLVILYSDIKKFFLNFSKQLHKFSYKRKFIINDVINSKTFIHKNKKMLIFPFKLVQNNIISIERTITAVRHLNLFHTFLSYNYFKVIL